MSLIIKKQLNYMSHKKIKNDKKINFNRTSPKFPIHSPTALSLSLSHPCSIFFIPLHSPHPRRRRRRSHRRRLPSQFLFIYFLSISGVLCWTTLFTHSPLIIRRVFISVVKDLFPEYLFLAVPFSTQVFSFIFLLVDFVVTFCDFY
jgi:hypothetical protein